MARKEQHINIKSSTESLSLVRDWVSKQARDNGFDETSIQELTLAVDEACSNVVRHAYPYTDEGPVEISCRVKKKSIVVTIRDEGFRYEPNSYIEPKLARSIAERRGGGFGVMLIRKLMDEVEYRSRKNRNEIRLTKFKHLA